jgi:hypothetical protein
MWAQQWAWWAAEWPAVRRSSAPELLVWKWWAAV